MKPTVILILLSLIFVSCSKDDKYLDPYNEYIIGKWEPVLTDDDFLNLESGKSISRYFLTINKNGTGSISTYLYYSLDNKKLSQTTEIIKYEIEPKTTTRSSIAFKWKHPTQNNSWTVLYLESLTQDYMTIRDRGKYKKR